MPHGLELAYSKACKAVQIYNKVVPTVATRLCYFYIKSLLNRANLTQAAPAVDERVQVENIILQGHVALDQVIKISLTLDVP